MTTRRLLRYYEFQALLSNLYCELQRFRDIARCQGARTQLKALTILFQPIHPALCIV